MRLPPTPIGLPQPSLHALELPNYGDVPLAFELELDEMRELVIMLHPSATKPDVRKAMLEVRKFTDSDGKLDEPNFADALVTVEEFMIKTLGDAVYSQERSLAGERITDLGGKIRLRGSVQGAESPKTRLRNKSSFVGRLIKAGSPSASKSASRRSSFSSTWAEHGCAQSAKGAWHCFPKTF